MNNNLAIGSNDFFYPVVQFHDLFMEETDRVRFRADWSDNRDMNQHPNSKVIAQRVH